MIARSSMTTIGLAHAPISGMGEVRSASAEPAPAEMQERALRLFGLYMVVHVALEQWFYVAVTWSDVATAQVLRAVFASVAASVALVGRERIGAALLAAMMLESITHAFPRAPNHALLELLALLALATHNRREARDGAGLEQVLSGLLAATMLGAGVQKVLHGTYADGTYLAFAIAHSERFAQVFGPLLSAAESARLAAISSPYVEGAGPYVLRDLHMLVLSNAIYLVEIALGMLLLLRRTRPAAAYATIGLVLLIEVAAQEAFFGCLIVSLAALAARMRRQGSVAIVLLMLLAFVLCTRIQGLAVLEHVN